MRRFFLRPIVFCLLLLAAGAAEDSANLPASAAAPRLEDDLANFVKERGNAQRALWIQRMEEEKKWLAQAVALTGDQSKAVAQLAGDAIARAMAEWSEAARVQADDLRHDKILQPTLNGENLADYWDADAITRLYGKYRPPAAQAIWREGLAALLSPAQIALWQKELPAHRADQQKPFAQSVKNEEGDYREAASEPLTQETALLVSSFALSEAQQEKLQALVDHLLDQRMDEWRSEAADFLADLPPEAKIVAPGDEVALPQPRALTADDPGWRAGLGEILDAPTWQALTKLLEQKQARRPRVLAQVLVLLLDQELRCTVRQREQLLPLAERWVQARPDLLPEQNRESFTTPLFLAAAARATAEELSAILEAPQIRAWQTLCVPGIVDDAGEFIARPAVAQSPAAPELTGTDLEELLQGYFRQVEQKVRTRCLARILGRAQEIGRVCALPEETRARLQTAARGAAEASLAEWRGTIEGGIREQVNTIGTNNLEMLRNRLSGLAESGQMTELTTVPEKQPLWLRTWKSVQKGLPSAPAEALRREDAARRAFRRQAIAGFLLEDFNRIVYLTSDQMPKAAALLDTALKTYGLELDQQTASSENPWYFPCPDNLMLFMLVPQPDFRALLTPAQWAGWSKSEAFQQAENDAPSVKAHHSEAVQEEKDQLTEEGK